MNDSPQDQRRVHGFISGQVQGVFFRATMRDKASEFGVNGWVRNLSDGRVEFVAEGPADGVEKLVSWARHGPPRAYVAGFDLTEETPSDAETRFRIRR